MVVRVSIGTKTILQNSLTLLLLNENMSMVMNKILVLLIAQSCITLNSHSRLNVLIPGTNHELQIVAV